MAGVLVSGKKLIAGAFDNGGKHKVANISANFIKNLQ